MDTPSIDSLLETVHGMYELAAVAGRRAIEIKKKDRDNTQPLQQALDEIRDGNVEFDFKKLQSSESVDGEQIELPLSIDAEKVKLDTSIATDVNESHESSEEAVDEKNVEEVDELGPEVGVLDDDYPPKILKEDISVNDED
jgi:DNA-directed RNA polymerase subunit K/omega